MAGRKTEAFPNSYWDRYTISLGQDNLYLDNAISTPSEEGGEYRFLLVGGISVRLAEAEGGDTDNGAAHQLDQPGEDHEDSGGSEFPEGSVGKDAIKP